MAGVCQSIYSCRVCNRNHNTLLHFEKPDDPKIDTQSQQTPTDNSDVSAAASMLGGLDQSYTFLATAVVLVTCSRGNQRECRAQLDSG